jgi:hypothetical protein
MEMRMRWFFAFLLLLTVWTGVVKVVLTDPVHWEKWDWRGADSASSLG